MHFLTKFFRPVICCLNQQISFMFFRFKPFFALFFLHYFFKRCKNGHWETWRCFGQSTELIEFYGQLIFYGVSLVVKNLVSHNFQIHWTDINVLVKSSETIQHQTLLSIRLCFTAIQYIHYIFKNKSDDAVFIWCGVLQRPCQFNWVFQLMRSAAFISQWHGQQEPRKRLCSTKTFSFTVAKIFINAEHFVYLKTFIQKRLS